MACPLLSPGCYAHVLLEETLCPMEHEAAKPGWYSLPPICHLSSRPELSIYQWGTIYLTLTCWVFHLLFFNKAERGWFMVWSIGSCRNAQLTPRPELLVMQNERDNEVHTMRQDIYEMCHQKREIICQVLLHVKCICSQHCSTIKNPEK